MDDSQLRLVIEAQNRASKTLSQIQRDVEKLSSSNGRQPAQTCD
nr:MAG TPA: hypothetical protein [Caudoviricetes sp.]